MGSTTSPAEFGESIGQSIGQSIGGAIIVLWVIGILIIAVTIAVLVWFLWVMTRIKNENVKTNKLLADLNKSIGRFWQPTRQSDAATALVSDELAKYKSLLDNGAITEEEYNIKKIQLLNK